MNILITGASGFIGSHLLKKLSTLDAQIFCLVQDQSRFKIKSGPSIEVLPYKTFDEIENLLKNIKFDYVFHLATYYSRQHIPQEIQKITNTNLTFGTYILEHIRKNEGVFVNTDTFFYLQGTEMVIPENLYAASKAAFNEILKFYSINSKLRILNLVLTDTYGPQDPRDKLVNQMMKSMRGEDVQIFLNNPDKEISLIHVDDTVEALISVMEKSQAIFGDQKYRSYSLQPQQVFTLKALAEKLKKLKPKMQLEIAAESKTANPRYVKRPILPNWQPQKTDTIDEIIKIVDQKI